MSVDIQKQLDLRPYSDKNVVSTPVKQSPPPPTHDVVDEEKSNAAKWMIGLTASAAIVLGGLYAAKHGHLGKDAEKFAKKIFGESVKEVKPAATTTTTPPTTLNETVPTAIALTPLVFARKGISRLIKKPNKSLTEVMTELQQAGVKMEKKGENLLEIQTGKSPNDITKLFFNSEGTLASIQRATKKAQQEVFKFENGILSKIERQIPTPSGKPLEHLIEFAENGKVKAKKLVLNDALENLPINSKTLNKFKPDEIVEAYIPRDSKYFNQAVEEFQVLRKHAQHFGDDSTITCHKVFKGVQEAERNTIEAHFFEENTMKPSGLAFIIEKQLNGSVENKFNAEILKLVQKDLGDLKGISYDNYAVMYENYVTKLNTFKINSPEHVAIVGKPIKDCSYDEFVEILRQVAPEKAGKLGVVQDPWKDSAQEQKAIMSTIEYLTGRSNIKENTSLLDILQDL